jgi:hypothetical protein
MNTQSPLPIVVFDSSSSCIVDEHEPRSASDDDDEKRTAAVAALAFPGFQKLIQVPSFSSQNSIYSWILVLFSLVLDCHFFPA